MPNRQLEMLPMVPTDRGCPGASAKGSGTERAGLDQPFVSGSVDTPAGRVPRVASPLTRRDRWGAFKVRWGAGRMRYAVEPGLYALEDADAASPVLVTANYKLSFDRLRQALPNRRAWILVLDTQGINVWCAAGKGTFGTAELTARIHSSGLAQVVQHRDLILPQLGAPGVAAHEVKKMTGFRVIYGPVRSRDLPAFLDNGRQATPAMRQKTFSLGERAILIPMELVGALKASAGVALAFLLLGGLGAGGSFWENVMTHGILAAFLFLSAVVTGCVLPPLLLPFLPGRAFTTKGLFLGFLLTIPLLAFFEIGGPPWIGRLERMAWGFLIPAIMAYLTMNFTGASTYTSLSGVKKEMRWGVPLQIAMGSLGCILWMGGRLFG